MAVMPQDSRGNPCYKRKPGGCNPRCENLMPIEQRPLHIVTSHGYGRLAQLLLDYKANPLEAHSRESSKPLEVRKILGSCARTCIPPSSPKLLSGFKASIPSSLDSSDAVKECAFEKRLSPSMMDAREVSEARARSPPEAVPGQDFMFAELMLTIIQ